MHTGGSRAGNIVRSWTTWMPSRRFDLDTIKAFWLGHHQGVLTCGHRFRDFGDPPEPVARYGSEHYIGHHSETQCSVTIGVFSLPFHGG